MILRKGFPLFRIFYCAILICNMPSENTRRIVKNTAMLYIRMLLIMAVTLYTSRVVLNVLGVEDYGIYNVVGGIVVMFSFMNGAMAQATQRFFAYEIGRNDFTQLHKVFCLSVTVHIGIAFFIFLLAETVGLWFLNTRMNIPVVRMEAARWIYQCSVFSFMVTVVQVPYNAMIIARERMHIYACIGIVEVVLKLLIVFVLKWVAFDKLKLYGVLVFIVTVLIALFYRIYCKYCFQECRYRFIWDKQLYEKLTGFAGWSMFGTLAWMCKSQGLNLILNIFFGPLLNAAYGIANQVNTAVNSFVQNFTTALNPQIVKSYAANDRDYMEQLLFRGAKFSYYLLLLFALPLLMETEFILRLWLKMVPDYAVVFTRLVLVNSLLESFTYVMGTSIQATGKIRRYQLIIGGTILLNLPLAWLLLKLQFLPSVILVVSIVISCITLVERLLILQYLLGISVWRFVIQVFWKAAAVTFIAGILPLFLKISVPDGWGKFAGVILCSMLCTLFAEFFVGFTSGERNYLLQIVRNSLKR